MKKFVNEKFILLFVLMFIIANPLFSQQNKEKKDSITLKGVVVNDKGEPNPGISIVVKGTTHGTMTDFNGEFQLKVSKGAVITLSYVGMTSLEFKTVESSNIRVNIDQNLIEFCCTNHTPSHCATILKEMKKLAEKKNCSF